MAFGRNKKEKKSKKKDKAAGVAQEPELIIGEVQTPKTVGATMLEKGVPTLKDMMAPPSFDRTEFDHLGIGDRVMRSFLLSGFPKHIMVGWADKLYNYDGDLDMTIHINPMDEREAIDELTDKITQYEAQLDVESEKGQTRNMTRLGNQITELVREREKIEQNYISMFQVQMICNLYGKTVDQLDKETQMLDNTLRGKKIKLLCTCDRTRATSLVCRSARPGCPRTSATSPLRVLRPVSHSTMLRSLIHPALCLVSIYRRRRPSMWTSLTGVSWKTAIPLCWAGLVPVRPSWCRC